MHLINRGLVTCLVLAAIACLALAFQAPGQGSKEKLLKPSLLNERAPDVYQVKFDTSKGTFVIEVTRSWAPIGADRFYNLVKNGFYDDCRFFRVLAGFMAQFGMNGDPKLNSIWWNATLKADPVKQQNKRGYVTYAMGSDPNTRSTQVFINYSDRNTYLDGSGFAPFGKVTGDGMKVVDSLYSGYGEGAPQGSGPSQELIFNQGNAYLEKSFPKLDTIKSAVIVPAAAK
jgi:peptidyl-prolyl cis-trans isomerase A (cyclophilin A)